MTLLLLLLPLPRDMLASASVDNNIIVWDCRSHMATAQNSGTGGGGGNRSNVLAGGGLVSPFRVLSGHQSFVKGVSFDPVGRFLARYHTLSYHSTTSSAQD